MVLDKPTRDGDGEIHILTNLPKKAARAKTVANFMLRLLRLEPRVAAGPIALAGADVITILLYLNLAPGYSADPSIVLQARSHQSVASRRRPAVFRERW